MEASKSRPSDRREQIQREAALLFTTKGYDGTPIRAIAKNCGITEAAIYRHFENKDDLYQSVIKMKAAQHDIKGTLDQQANQGSIEDVLTFIAGHILELAEKDPQLMQLMFRNSFQNGPAARLLFVEVRLPYIEFLAGEMKIRQDKGELLGVDAFTSSRCFVGMVMDCALNTGVWTTLTNQEFVAENVICNNIPIFARGLTIGQFNSAASDDAAQLGSNP